MTRYSVVCFIGGILIVADWQDLSGILGDPIIWNLVRWRLIISRSGDHHENYIKVMRGDTIAVDDTIAVGETPKWMTQKRFI